MGFVLSTQHIISLTITNYECNWDSNKDFLDVVLDLQLHWYATNTLINFHQ